MLYDYHLHMKDQVPFDYKQYRAPELVWLCVVLSFSQQEEDRELIRQIYDYAVKTPSNHCQVLVANLQAQVWQLLYGPDELR